MTLSSVSLCEIWSEVKDWGGFFIFEHCQRHIQPSLVEYFCRMNCSNKTANKHKSSFPPSTSQPPTPLSPCSSSWWLSFSYVGCIMAALLVAVREANLSAGQWFILTAASIISAPFFIPLLKRKERNCHLHCEGSLYWHRFLSSLEDNGPTKLHFIYCSSYKEMTKVTFAVIYDLG